jgi:hypothetical protein
VEDPTSDNFEVREGVNDTALQASVLLALADRNNEDFRLTGVARPGPFLPLQGIVSVEERLYRVIKVEGGYFIFEIIQFIG